MKTLTVITAKHIAKQHGLTMEYIRKAGGYWLLRNPAAQQGVDQGFNHVYRSKELLEACDVEVFYVHCMNVACNTINKEQMQKVVDRAVFEEISQRLEMERLEGKEQTIIAGYVAQSVKVYSADKIVHTMEDAIQGMREELEAIHGSYSDHKALCKPGVDPITKSILANFGIAAEPVKTAPTQSPAAQATAAAYKTIAAVLAAVPGHMHGCYINLTHKDGENMFSLFAAVGPDTYTHTLNVSATSEARLLAHWTGFIANIRQVRFRILTTGE